MSFFSEGTKKLVKIAVWICLFKELVVFHTVFMFLCYLSESIEEGVFLLYEEKLKNSLKPSFG